MKPFFCFYGGKWRAAPHYPKPIHDTIVEPFAGAAGYATRYPDRRVVLVEKDPVIAGLWMYLTRVKADEVLRLPLLSEGQSTDDLHVAEEARTLIGFWINKGSSAPRKTPSAWMRSGMRARSFWGAEIRSRIASQVERVRHWRVFCSSYSDATCPSGPATWYVDPPYERQGRYYRHSSDVIDFRHLAAWCRALHGQVIVCEQAGASWLPFRPFVTIKANPSQHGGKSSREVIWTGDDLSALGQAEEGQSFLPL